MAMKDSGEPQDDEIESLRNRMQREVPIMGVDEREMRALSARSDANRETYRPQLETLKSHCFFIGYPRTGHSLIGSLLDAHPDVVMAHELDVIRFQEAGFDRAQIEYLLIENARLFGRAGRIWGTHDYTVPGQWQGRFRTLRVLGDKKGGQTTARIARDPQRLDALLSLFGGRVRFIHVVRNPFDTIAYFHGQWGGPRGSSLADSARAYFGLVRANAMIRARVGRERVIDVRHEDLVADPRGGLERLCRFLQVDPERGYLAACADIVSGSPRRSRDALDWTSEDVELVETESNKYDCLQGYTFAT